MAKAKAKPKTNVTLEFPRTGNPWMDAGTVGLYRILMGRPSYLKDAPGWDGVLPGAAPFPDVTATLEPERLVVIGPAGQVQACLEKAYDRLIACYYDLSSQKQIEERRKYNFYYKSSDDCFFDFYSKASEDCFVAFPKKRAAGAGLLLYDKQARPSGSKIEWEKEERTKKKKPGQLPRSHAHLQDRLDAFLAENKLKAGPGSGLLVDGENEVRPKVAIKAKAKQGKDLCFLTGKAVPGLGEAKNTAFPLFGGSRSFANQGREKLRIGWQFDFVGKFVPALAFFSQERDDLHLFFPEALSLRRLNEMADKLQHMVARNPNLFRNFDQHLGGHFRRRSEVTLAFLHRVFEELSKESKARLAEAATAEEEDEGESLLAGPPASEAAVEPAQEPEAVVSTEAVYDAALRGGEVAFTIVSAAKQGPIWKARDFWSFHDLIYLARLFERMEGREQSRSGRVRMKCRPKALMRALIDFEKKDKTVLRDRVCEAVLHKRSVLALLERQAFRAFTQSDPSRPPRLSPLLDFAVLYEIERYEGPMMTKEDYKKMAENAKWLGNNIADGVVQAVQDPERRESPGRAKGAFFRLRKCRTNSDFLDELARLQNRYQKIAVPPEALDADIFNHATFEEYRGFCVVAALSRYQWKSRAPQNQ